MGGVVRPNGRLPARVYWFRRLLLLALAGTVVLAGRWWIADDARARPPGRPAATPSTTKSSPRPAPTPKPPSRPTFQGRCDPSRVGMDIPALAPTRIGEPVAIRLRLWSPPRTRCTLELDAAHLVVEVSQNGDDVWSTDECPTAVVEEYLTVRPNGSRTAPVTWSGQSRDDGCTGRSTRVDAGGYRVAAALVGGEPVSSTLRLVEAPKRRAEHGSRGRDEPE